MQANTAPAFIKRAAQPDIVRSVQKDELYLQQTTDTCNDVARHLLGPYGALRHSREVKLLASLLYHGLTTGAGAATLGEEYCDILQTGASGRLPRHGQQWLLVLLQSLGPYLADRAATSLERGLPEGQQHQGQQAQQYSFEEEEEDDATPPAAQQHSSTPGGGAAERAASASSSAAPSSSSAGASTSSSIAARLPRLLARAREELRARRQQAAGWLAGNWPELKSWLLFSGRLHLAFFYLTGTHYEWTKRLAGIHYASMGHPSSRAPSYRVLGVLLSLQLAISAGIQAQEHVALLAAKAGLRPGFSTEQVEQHAAVLQEEEEEGEGEEEARRQQEGQLARRLGDAAAAAAAGAGGQGAPPGAVAELLRADPGSGKQCPLCLCPRSQPACTPCGHVFCWACAAHWCSERPECPLCRAPVAANQLVRLYYADY